MSEIRLPRTLRELAGPIVLALAFAGIYSHFLLQTARLDIDVRSDKHALVQVFWKNPDSGYAQKHSQEVRTDGELRRYSFPLGNLGRIDTLRIDPGRMPGEVVINNLQIRQPGFAPILLKDKQLLSRLESLKDIAGVALQPKGIVVQTSGKDPQLRLSIEPGPRQIPPRHWVVLILGSLLVAWGYWVLSRLNHGPWLIPGALLAVFALALVMATITPSGVHPDEPVHSAAADYYNDHWLPPAVDDPDIAHTFSVYGKSRLSSYEIYYPLAGYFSRLLGPFQVNSIMDYRAFNLMLLLAMLLFCARVREFQIFALPLLLSAQAWYLFSYVNSDGFALFLVVIAAYQAAVPSSTLNRFLCDKSLERPILSVVTLGALFGALILLKANNLFFLLFLLLYLMWRLYMGDFPDRRLLLRRLGVLLVIAACLPAMRYALDMRANGFESATKYRHMITVMADKPYNPLTPLEEQNIYLGMRDRGVALEGVIRNHHWGEKSLISAFGSFGFTQYNPDPTFVTLLKVTGFLLVLTVISSILINAPNGYLWILLAALGCTAGLIGISLWASWAVNFQPQGRYFAPVLGIMGILLYHTRPYLFRMPVYALTGAMFIMGVYAFIFVGLAQIQKTAY